MDNMKLLDIPDSAFYFPNYLSKEKENFLLTKVYHAPKTKWTCLSNRRLQNWGGLPHPKGMMQEKLPEWLLDCCRSVSETKAFDNREPNHVLINEYKPGQGIMPHQDGPLYYPTVATLSLGCHTLLDFYQADSEATRKYEFSLLLERRSLLILKESMYTRYLHGIAENVFDEIESSMVKNLSSIGDETLKEAFSAPGSFALERHATRVSLTIRNVPKTVKFKLKT